jgi:chromosome segregation ATPase
MSKNIDFIELWKKGGEGAPRASIIGGLQKLLNNKEKELIELKTENQSLRAQIAENIALLDEAEKVIAEQTSEIENLRAGFVSVDEQGKKILKPSMPAISKDSGQKMDEATLRKIAIYEQQIRSLEEKLYIYSNLPDRITQLEQQKDELTKKLDQYVDREESLRNTIKRLTSGMDDKATIESVMKENEELKQKLNTLQQKGGSVSGGDEAAQIDLLQSTIRKIETEKSFLTQQVNELMSQKSLMENKLQEVQNQLRALQTAGNQGLAQEQALQYQTKISALQQELNKIREASKIDPVQLQKEVTALRAENAQIKKELEEKSRAQPVDEFVQDLQAQVQRLKAQNKKLQDELAAIKGTQ